jgi:hypothetical protein
MAGKAMGEANGAIARLKQPKECLRTVSELFDTFRLECAAIWTQFYTLREIAEKAGFERFVYLPRL